MDHPIEYVIHEINMFAFSDIEEANESCIWLGNLKSCYDSEEYHKDNEQTLVFMKLTPPPLVMTQELFSQ